MPKPTAATVADYLERIPENRRAAVSAVREVIVRNLPAGYVESMAWGMITYHIPLARFPNTYNGQPLGYVALAGQKSYCSLHLMRVYGDPVQEAALREAFRRAGKKLDMGKACVRFHSPEDLPLDAIGELVASTPPDAWIAAYERMRAEVAARPRGAARGARKGARGG